MKAIVILAFIFLLACNSQQEQTKPEMQELKTQKVEIPEQKRQTKNNENKTISSAEVKKETKLPKQSKVILDVPIIAQNPELKYGCEVTSLAMVLQHAGVKVNKMTLAEQVAKDPDPVTKNSAGDIIQWGDPNRGFVGDMTGRNMGYAIYAKPLEKLMERYLPGRTVNLTNSSFDQLLQQIQKGRPVVVWTTGDFKLPDRWESWQHGSQRIKTPLDLHAVVLVGYDSEHVYVNDPLTGKKAQKVDKDSFIQSWIALKKQALSYN